MNDVKVKIDLLKPSGTSEWGYPLIVTKDETTIGYAVCTSLAEVVAAGFASSTDVYKAAEKMFMQPHPPLRIAVAALTALTAENLAALTGEGWRQLVVMAAAADKTEVKTYIDTTDKMYFAAVTSASGLSAFADDDRVVCVVHGTEADLAAAAVAGEVAGREVGTITYKNLILNGITPATFTDAQVEAIHTAGGITVLKKAGDIVTSEGLVVSGEYADIIDCKDYIIQQLTYKTQKLLNTMGKLPYDNRGIAILENAAIDVLKDAYNRGMIAEDDDGNPLYSASYALRSEVDANDIAARKFKGGRFAFTLAGAIHNVEITGEISVA